MYRVKAEFDIPDEMMKEYPKLVKLILKTGSMDDDDRQFWFYTFKDMSACQVQKLFDILENERVQLARVDKKFREEVRKIKHMLVKEVSDEYHEFIEFLRK